MAVRKFAGGYFGRHPCRSAQRVVQGKIVCGRVGTDPKVGNLAPKKKRNRAGKVKHVAFRGHNENTRYGNGRITLRQVH